MKIQIATSLGTGPTKLAAFDDALNRSGVANYNLIKLSSVIPQGATIKLAKQKIRKKPGEWGDRLYVVMADMRVNTQNKEAWAGIGWVQDKRSRKGVFVEHEGSSKESVEKDIKDSLKALVKHRDNFGGDIKMTVVGGVCKNEPICALAVAVYESERWQN